MYYPCIARYVTDSDESIYDTVVVCNICDKHMPPLSASFGSRCSHDMCPKCILLIWKTLSEPIQKKWIEDYVMTFPERIQSGKYSVMQILQAGNLVLAETECVACHRVRQEPFLSRGDTCICMKCLGKVTNILKMPLYTGP